MFNSDALCSVVGSDCCLESNPVPMPNILDSLYPTFCADHVAKSLRTKRGVEQPFKAFAPHCATLAAINPAQRHLKVNSTVSTGEVPDPSEAAIVPATLNRTTGPTCCFFERRFSRMTSAFRFPNTPFTSLIGTRYFEHLV